MVSKNCIILTMERCGCSTVGGLISAFYQRMFNHPLYFNYEISRMIAINPKYVLPQGYCSVYYVKLEWLLNKGYEKIVVLKQSLDKILPLMIKYYFKDLTLEQVIEKNPEWIEKIKFYYDLVFNHGIKDERVHEVDWFDLTNYTVATVSNLLDFLEFPVKNRPILFPLPVQDRDFDKYSTILGIGHEEGIPSENKYSQFVHEEQVNPYKIAPEEYWKQEARVYRIKPEQMPDILEIEGYL